MSENQEHKNDFDQSFKKRFEEDAIQPPKNAWSDLNAQFEEMDNEGFDATVREKFNDGINPPEFLWTEVDKATQEKPRRIRGAYWIFLSCVLGGLGTYFLVENINPTYEVDELSISKNITQEVPENSDKIKSEEGFKGEVNTEDLHAGDTIKKDTSSTSENRIMDNLEINNKADDYSREITTAKKEIKQPLKSKVNSQSLEPSLAGEVSKNQAEEINKDHPAAESDRNKGNSNDTLEKDSHEISTQIQPSDSIIQNEQSKQTLADLDSNATNAEKDSLMSSVDSLSIKNDFNPDSIDIALADTLIDSNLVSSKDSTEIELDDRNINQKKLKNDSIKKWMVSAYATREIQYLRVISDSIANNHVFDSLYTSNKWLFELGVSYTIKNQLQIGLGVSMNKFTYQYSKSAYGGEGVLPIETSYPSGVVVVNALFGKTQTPDLIEIQMAPQGADLTEFLYDKEILYNERLDYTLVNIPVDVKWVPGKLRIKPVIKVGGEINILVNSSSEVSLTFLQETATVQNHAQLKALNFSGSFGVGTQIDLVKGLGITFLPSLNYQPGGIYTNSDYQFTPYSIRLYSGLYYKF